MLNLQGLVLLPSGGSISLFECAGAIQYSVLCQKNVKKEEKKECMGMVFL